MISTLIADDHDLMRQGIRSLLESHPNIEVCAEAKDGFEAVERAVENRPDVVVLDVSMPRMNGLEAAREIRKRLPETQILIFTVHDTDEMVREILDAGAHGYILKSDASSQLAAAVEAVSQRNLYFSSGVSNIVIDSLTTPYEWKDEENHSEIPLTPREIDIVSLLAQGKSNKEIATELFISVRTVETHRRTIHRKLELNSLAELVRYAIRHGLVRP
jgi:DNA-binding NarL/FixJ family response regulator